MDKLSLSVRALVDFSARSGDLFTDEFDGPNHIEGIRGHQKIQASRDAPWQKEYAVKHVAEFDDTQLTLKGRIDLVNAEAEPKVIEEIKTTYIEHELISDTKKNLHWAQVKVYAYLFAASLENVEKDTRFCVKATWYNLLNDKASSEETFYSFESLQSYTEELIHIYLSWHKLVTTRNNETQVFCKNLEFPHKQYRPGQYEFAKQSYIAIKNKHHALIEAPTGIGKTISALFPAVKAIGENIISQAIYLTAKGSIQAQVISTLEYLTQKKNTVNYLLIQAKAKACPCRSNSEEIRNSCDSPSGKCKRTLGFYDRLPEARKVCLDATSLDSPTIQAIADRFELCPFELSLQMIPWSTLIICDYNYVFDPLVHLAVFDDTPSKRSFIIDEIHNLPDRGRDMYSAELSVSDTQDIAKALWNQSRPLSKAAKALAKAINALNPMEYPAIDAPKSICAAVDKIIKAYHANGEDVLTSDLLGNLPMDFPEWIKQIFRFAVISELYSEKHRSFLIASNNRKGKNTNHAIQLRCLDAAHFIKQKYNCARSLTGFSATLNPLGFYQTLLKLDENTQALQLPSSFPPDNQLTLRCDFIDTRWQAREQSLAKLVELIHLTFIKHPGKHIIFFPSYDYLNKTYEQFQQANCEIPTIKQESNSSDEDRKIFLNDFFENKEDKIGFAIMGGIFGEAVDFSGDALHAVMIVGSGMPQPSEEQKLIQKQFQETGFNGYQFAFQFPGFTRVQQTAGRVIRSEKDRGLVILVDPRFQRPDYMTLMPEHWRVQACPDLSTVEQRIQAFNVEHEE